MTEVRALCDDYIGKELYQIIISNPKSGSDINKVKIRPIMLKNTLIFQATEYKGTQVFHENYETSKGEMGGSIKHVVRDVQKYVQGDGKGNEDKCIEGESISTTTCIKGMPSLIYYFMYNKFNYCMKY